MLKKSMKKLHIDLIKQEETLIKEKLIDTINVSLDAYTPETFVKIRGGREETFSVIKENIISAYALKTRLKKEIKIMVNIIDQPLCKRVLLRHSLCTGMADNSFAVFRLLISSGK